MNKLSFKKLAIDMIVQVALVVLIRFFVPNLSTALVTCVVFYFVVTHRKINHLKEELREVLLIITRGAIDN